MRFSYQRRCYCLSSSIYLLCCTASDKPFVLEHPHALDDLVTALLLDEHNPRRTQDGADILQATAALALENLALSDVGKAPLRAHTGVMKGLRALKQDAMSDAARRSASAALFELDQEARQKAKKAAHASGSSSSSSSSDDDNDVVGMVTRHELIPEKIIQLAETEAKYEGDRNVPLWTPTPRHRLRMYSGKF